MMLRKIMWMAGVLTLAVGFAAAQDEDQGWKTTADVSFNLNQASYSNSWAGGESASIVWTAQGNLTAEKTLSEKFNWRNTLKLSFGQTHSDYIDDQGQRKWESPEKSTDRIFLESLMRMPLGSFVDPFAAVTFDSQFYNPADSLAADGARAVRVLRPLDPITLTESVGVARTFIKSEETEFMSRMGFAVRQHMATTVLVYDPEETESENTMDGGLEWVTDLAHTFGGGNMKYVSKLRVFQALYNSEEDELDGETADDWQTADVAWENTLSASVSKYIQVSLFAEVLYDKEIDLRGRFRETLGLGIAYKLF